MCFYLPASFDDFVIDVCDDHGVDHSDSKQFGQNPLHNIKPDIWAMTRWMEQIMHRHKLKLFYII